MDCRTIRYAGHAVRQMFARSIRREDVVMVLRTGATIAEYPEDQPYPSRLLLGFVQGRPLHVVVGYDEATPTCFVVTAYIPDADTWESDWATRKQRP
jgi:hypothetical protein